MRLKWNGNRVMTLLMILAVGMVGGSLWYSNQLVSRLAAKEERLVNFWADAIQFVANPEETETAFIFNNLIKEKEEKIVPVPAIMTDQYGKPFFVNLPDLPPDLDPEKREKKVARELAKMKANPNFQPLRIEYLPGKYQYIYYRETEELRRLRYFPWVMLSIIAGFVIVLFANFYVAQRNQENKVWVGLARETAHQLGTPISGLLAWLELLKSRQQAPADQEVLDEMAQDVQHLELVAERFSKIGSEPELAETEVQPILDQAVSYLRSRASRKVDIQLESDLPAGYQHLLNPVLFQWVVENLLKNAYDALTGGQGTIVMEARLNNGDLEMDISDTGRGIERSKWGQVFKPGYTTKKRGWGLGLSLSRRIINRYHRGKLFIKRSELERGTTFRLQLPNNTKAVTQA